MSAEDKRDETESYKSRSRSHRSKYESRSRSRSRDRDHYRRKYRRDKYRHRGDRNHRDREKHRNRDKYNKKEKKRKDRQDRKDDARDNKQNIIENKVEQKVRKQGVCDMIEVILNDRLGKKIRVKCNSDDSIGDLKKLVAVQTGTRPEKIRIQKWYTVYKDHISLADYEIKDGLGLELYYD